jgi:hypothetical protein
MSDQPATQPPNGETDGAAFQQPLEAAAQGEQRAPESFPPDNIMMHRYRELSEPLAKELRQFKDVGLQLWNELHMIDGSSTELRSFNHYELANAATKLEEMLLWVEKFYNV